MIKSTFGAFLGGTTRGAHQALDCSALSLITPPNFGSGGGSCFPSMDVVALAEPGVPVLCCADARRATNIPAAAVSTNHAQYFRGCIMAARHKAPCVLFVFIVVSFRFLLVWFHCAHFRNRNWTTKTQPPPTRARRLWPSA